MGEAENAIVKKMSNYSLKARKKVMKEPIRADAPISIKYGKNSLLDKIISSNINENAAAKRLEQISYSAINGQRQTEDTYKPEGVQMLGQLGREKPLEAITKEMIQEYQDEEMKPVMVDGETRKYAKADYEPIFQVPVSIDDIKDDIRIIYKNKVATAKALKDADEYLKTADEYYRGLLRDINLFGMTDAKRKEKEQTERHIIQERMNYDKLRNDMDKYEYEIKRLMAEGKEINRKNALIPQQNREEVAKYEQSLLQHNRNRLNLQQQPYESDMDYYKRLREIESEKVNPVLYKQYSINKASKELKPKLESLFKDESMIEGIIKSLSDTDKMIINKNFSTVEKAFIDKHGYNPSMNTKMAVEAILEPFASKAAQIQALIKRKNAQDITIPDLLNKRQEEAVETLKAVFKRKKIEPRFARVIQKSRELEDKTDAATTLQAILKRKKIEPKYARVVKKAREIEDEKTRAKELLSSALLRSKLQPVVAETLAEQKATNVLQAAAKRASYQSGYQAFKKHLTKQERKAAKLKERELLRNQELYLQDIETRIPLIEQYTEYRKGLMEQAINPQKALVEQQIRKARYDKPATLIQSVLRGHKARREALQKAAEISTSPVPQKSPYTPPTPARSSSLSYASTLQQQQEEEERNRLRFPRSDIGVPRMPYKVPKNIKASSVLQARAKQYLTQKKYEAQQKATKQIQKWVRGNIEKARQKQVLQQTKDVFGDEEEIARLLDLSQKAAEAAEEAEKKKRGRPAGAKNKATLAKEAAAAALAAQQAAKTSVVVEEPEKKLSPMEKALQERIAKQLRKVEKPEPSPAKTKEPSPPRAAQRTPSPDLGRKLSSKEKKILESLVETQMRKEPSPPAVEEPEKKLSPMEKALQARIAKQLRKVEKPEPSPAKTKEPSPPPAAKQKSPSPPRAAVATPAKPKPKTLAEQLAEKKLKKTPQPPEGSGIRPKRRQVKVSSKDKKKDRLRLVTSQIQAGNNNPKLLVELNKLYKELYGIDNAFMYFKK